MMLSEASRKRLLHVARRAIEIAVGEASARDGVSVREFEDDGGGVSDESRLHAPGAAFVTLHGPDGELRGCVGTVEPLRPLIDVVANMARSAAQEDPRFMPVRPDEVDGLRIEISVLGPMLPIGSVEEIFVGRDGLMIARRGARGLLLPQVASERGWDPRTFLEHTCQKAGLPREAYEEPDARIFRFEAEVFGEPETSV